MTGTRLGCAVAILAVVVWRWGAEPFVDAFGLVDPPSLGVAVAVTAATTLCCAHRWSLVARNLGVEISLPAAVAAYYRSQLLNVTLPGGVIGDAHRAVRHGREAGSMGRGLRSVVWERTAGQVVQILLTVLLLLVLPSPLRTTVLVIVVVAAVALGVVLTAATALRRVPIRREPPGRAARFVRAVVDDLRNVVLMRRAWPGIVLASAAAVIGHAAVFVLAMTIAGVDTSTARALPLALIVLLAAAVPTNIAGWGPREGVAAWVFGVAGLGAAQGVTVAALYGVMVFVATLPGVAVLVAPPARRHGVTDPGPLDRRLEGSAVD